MAKTTKRAFVRRLRLYENREEGTDHGSHQLGVRVALQLLEFFDHRRKERHASALCRALDVRHHVQDVAASSLFAKGWDARPLRDVGFWCARCRIRVAVGHVDRPHITIRPYLDAAQDILLRVLAHRVANSVSLDDAHTQVVRNAGTWRQRQDDKGVAIHQCRQADQALKLIEVLPTLGIARRSLGPQTPFALSVRFPLLSLFIRKAEEACIDASIQGQATAHDIRANGF